MNILSSFLYSKGEQDKILAYIKLSFTPDDDSVTDPIQFLRDAIQGKGNNNSTKRSVISGTLHGEKVQLINTTLITGKMKPLFVLFLPSAPGWVRLQGRGCLEIVRLSRPNNQGLKFPVTKNFSELFTKKYSW